MIDFAALLGALVERELAVVVVGGVAAVIGGAPVSTFDLDLVYRSDEPNLIGLAAVLQSLEASYRDPAGRHIVPDVERLRANRTNLLKTKLGPLDLLQTIGPGWRFDDVLARSSPLIVGGRPVRVLNLEAVIESKQVANREKDRATLPVLLRALAHQQRSAGEGEES
jgi:hypothetical protein